MPRFKRSDGQRIQFTPEEEAARDAEEAQWLIDKQAKIDAQTAFEANRASGKPNLPAGQALNDAELSPLFGD